MDVISSFRTRKTEAAAVSGSSSRNKAGILCINCGDCENEHDAGDPACMMCIAKAVSRDGAADRIRLCSGTDYEVYGEAADILCRLSSVVSVPTGDPGRQACARCVCRPSLVIPTAWETFPEPAFDSARSILLAEEPDDPECSSCVQRSMMSIDSSEKSLAGLCDTLARYSRGFR